MNNKKKLTWENKPKDIWRNDLFDTEEECIEDAIEQGYKAGDTIVIGEAEEYTINADVGLLLDRLEEDAYEQCGEIAADWNIYKKEHEKELEELRKEVTFAVEKFLKKINQEPYFYKIVGIREITIGGKE